MSPLNDSDTEVSQGLSAVLRALLVIADLLAAQTTPQKNIARVSLEILEDDLIDQGYLA
jgi:hypothetical protein